MTYQIYAVGEEAEYIVAQSEQEAVQDHITRIGEDWYKAGETVPVEVVPFDRSGRFETETDGYKDMTFGEFLGKDYVYDGPQVICWLEY